MTAPPTVVVSPQSAEQERAALLAWLRSGPGMEVGRMILMAGLPGGTATQRVKNRAFAAGCAHAVSMIIDAIERLDHLTTDSTEEK